MKVRLLLALHFHQPVGNFDTVFEDAVRLCYEPLVAHVERHPKIRAAFHLSGCLLEWLEAHDRALLDRVVALIGSGRIEPLGGGFYEPILPIIPREDALDQIERLAAYWQRRCGMRPRGAWIAERVWEPGLAELLADAGVAYTILDDQHLRFAGLLDERFTGLFVTERAGRSVAFLPSDFRLRYLIPFRPIEAVRAHFTEAAAAGDGPVLTYGDDAEKFGLWPGTHGWVHGEKWLDKFFTLLGEDDGPVLTQAPGEFVAEDPPARKVYLPNASYTEMLEWALPAASVASYAKTRAAALQGAPAESVRAFVRGPLWDMFLARYPEADQLHKHVLWTSRRARGLPADARGRAEAITAVLRAECNCAYWHGLFGGVYYPHLRHGAYQSLLLADAILDGHEGRAVRVERRDLDGDREDEVILGSAGTQAFFRPADGGTLVELDYLPARFNVTNVMSRFKEAYHEGADLVHAPEGGGAVLSPHEQAVGIPGADLLGRHFDLLPLRSLRDLRGDAPLDPDRLGRFEGIAIGAGRLAGWRTTEAGFRGTGEVGGVAYEKVVAIDPSGALRVTWEIGPGAAARSGWFGTLLCLSLLARQDPDRALIVAAAGAAPRGAGEGGGAAEARRDPGLAFALDGAVRVTLEDRVFGFALDVALLAPARVVACPIETLQRSEDRYEAAYQGTMIAICFSLAEGRSGAGPGRRAVPGITLSFRSLPSGRGGR